MPATDLLVPRPSCTARGINAAVILDRRGTVPSDHPRHDRPRALIVAGFGARQRRQAAIDLVLLLCHTSNGSR
ncbi:MAG: hypothetical protein M3O70_07685 [Actinomycetota bacterium]|nr:hypothetical protein [Actinomycetota bacterium]